MKTVGIVQSNYIPWKGYFDLINRCDEFILFDDMQFTKRDWRNRNVIKTQSGPLWLSIPVLNKGRFFQKICDTKVVDHKWADTHWKSIMHNYKDAPHFAQHRSFVANLYERAAKIESLSEINHLFLSELSTLLDIQTKFRWSMGYSLEQGASARLAQLTKDADGTRYLSGPLAKDYIVLSDFEERGVDLKFIDYGNYPIYPQRFGEFSHFFTVFDPLFNCGAKALAEMLKDRKANVPLMTYEEVHAATKVA